VMEGVLALKGKKSSVHLKNIMSTYGNTGKVKASQPGKVKNKPA